MLIKIKKSIVTAGHLNAVKDRVAKKADTVLLVSKGIGSAVILLVNRFSAYIKSITRY